MKTSLVAIIAGTAALALSACQEAPADGTAETPEPTETKTEAPTDIAVPAETAPETPAPEMAYEGPIPMPIRIGTDGADMDSCASYGEVTGLDPKGDNYLSVRDAPSSEVKERDRLDPGQGVHVCAESNGWYGVVYDKGGETRDCGTDSPIDKPRNYTGPCAQGWVSKKLIKITAG